MLWFLLKKWTPNPNIQFLKKMRFSRQKIRIFSENLFAKKLRNFDAKNTFFKIPLFRSIFWQLADFTFKLLVLTFIIYLSFTIWHFTYIFLLAMNMEYSKAKNTPYFLDAILKNHITFLIFARNFFEIFQKLSEFLLQNSQIKFSKISTKTLRCTL